jgi:predicted dehydrogenase
MLNPEEMKVGRRNFMKAAAVIPAVGAYAVTAKLAEPVNVAWIGTGGEGRVLLENADYTYIRVQAICDIRPDFLKLGELVVKAKSNPDVRVYTDYKKMLEDGGFEAVVIATPLSTHGPMTVDCLNAGKHVLCEKTMAYHAEECEAMISAAEKNNLILAIGHQRHANPLYLQAKKMMEDGLLGEVYHIRSLWHRNHSWRRGPAGEWASPILTEVWGERPIDGAIKLRPGLDKAKVREMTDQEQFDLYFEYLQKVASEKEGLEFDYQKWGYETADMLGNWRLYSKLSHGLMSELGSHQIDVCNWMWGAEPLHVSGTGGIFKHNDGRDVDDHVFAIFRYPNNKVMTFSSITTNAFDNYYDQIMGTAGTVYLTGEAQAMLFKEGETKSTEISVKSGKTGGAVMAASASRGADMAGGAASGEGLGNGINPFMAYQIEINQFATAIRKGDPSLVGCDGKAGYKAAIAEL